MTITIAQHTGSDALGGTATNPTLTQGSANTAANLMVGAVGWNNAVTLNSITDSAGNTYVVLGTNSTAGGALANMAIFYCLSIAAHASGNVLTFNFSGATAAAEAWVAEANTTTGTWSAGPFDSGTGTTGTAMSCAGVNVASQPTLGFGAAASGNGTTVTWGASFTGLDALSASDEDAWRAITTTGTITATATQGTSSSWSIVAGYFYTAATKPLLDIDALPPARRAPRMPLEGVEVFALKSAAALLKTGWDQDPPAPRRYPPRIFDDTAGLNKTRPLPTLFDSLDPLPIQRRPPIIFGDTAGLSKTKPLLTPFDPLDPLALRRAPPRLVDEFLGTTAKGLLSIGALADDPRPPPAKPKPLEDWAAFRPTKPLLSVGAFVDDVHYPPSKPKLLEEAIGWDATKPLPTLFFVDEVRPWPSKPKLLEEAIGWDATKPLLRLFFNDEPTAPVRRPPRLEEMVLTPRQVANLLTLLPDPSDTRPRLLRGSNFDDAPARDVLVVSLRSFLPMPDDTAPLRGRPRPLDEMTPLRATNASAFALFDDVPRGPTSRPRFVEDVFARFAPSAGAIVWPDDPTRRPALRFPDLEAQPLFGRRPAVLWADPDLRRPLWPARLEADPWLARILPPVVLFGIGWATDDPIPLRRRPPFMPDETVAALSTRVVMLCFTASDAPLLVLVPSDQPLLSLGPSDQALLSLLLGDAC